MKAFYFGPIEKHPLIKTNNYWQRICPVVTCFNFNSGNGWKDCWNDASIDLVVQDTINHAVYKNNGNGTVWHANDKYKANTWIKAGKNLALMDISRYSKRGTWDWTKGLTYLEAYKEAILRCNDLTPGGLHLIIENVYETLLKTQDRHEFFDTSFDYEIKSSWEAFIVWLISQKIPFIIADKAWQGNFKGDQNLYNLSGHCFDLDWLDLEPLDNLVEFKVDNTETKLYTRRYKTTGLDRLWAAKRITTNPNPYPVRGIAPHTSISKFAWIWKNEKVD